MGIGSSLVDWTQLHLAHFLSGRLATPLILAGTLALAAGGAAASTPAPAHQSPVAVQPAPLLLFPSIRCHPGLSGSMVCHIPDNQVAVYAVAYACRQDWQGDDTYVCPFMSK